MQTERILLRPWRDDDAAALYKYASDTYRGSIDYEYKFHIDTLTDKKLQWSFTYRDGHSDTWTFFRQ